VPHVVFTPQLQRFLDARPRDVAGTTVADALARMFADNPRLRSYVLDEHGQVRTHVAVFVGGERVKDRRGLTDVVSADAEIFVLQALSGGGNDWPGIHSILVDPRNSRHVLVGVSVGGAWECRARGMVAEGMPPERQGDPNVQDPHRIAACRAAPDVLWTQHHNGVFRSGNRGRLRTPVPAAKPSGFGFAVAAHPADPSTAWFVPAVKDERRVPVNATLVVSRTRDAGQTSDVISAGLPDHSYDLIYQHALDVDATGRTLAMGSTTGGLWISSNGGERWQTISTHLPPVYAVRLGL